MMSVEELRLSGTGEDLKQRVKELLVSAKQCSFRTTPAGEDFIVFGICVPTRFEDLEYVKEMVERHYYGTLADYLTTTAGTTYVRVYPETYTCDHPDRIGWSLIKCYARLLNSDRPRSDDMMSEMSYAARERAHQKRVEAQIAANTAEAEKQAEAMKAEVERQRVDFLALNAEIAGQSRKTGD